MNQFSTRHRVKRWIGAILLAAIIDGLAVSFFDLPIWSDPLIIIALAWGLHSFLMNRERSGGVTISK